MRTARGFRMACLALGLALVAVGCAGPQRDAGGDGVRGGTLRVLSYAPFFGLDTADSNGPIVRPYARTLYGYNLAGPPEQKTVPVPDIASGEPQISADRRTYTFTLRQGVRYAPPVNREVIATDFITAIERLYDKRTPSYGQQYAGLIAGAAAFGAGKATSISGLVAPDARTLQITLDQPAEDFLSILAMPFFAPVPGEYAAEYAVGDNYGGHVVGSGPYTLDRYDPGRMVVLVRNPNWDPATDPLRKAWVDRIELRLGVGIASIQQAIEREEADLSLDSHVPQARVDALRADPERSTRVSVNTTGSLLYLVLGTNPKAGAIADVRVRRAVNYAIDKAPTATPSPGGPPPPASWPPPSWHQAPSATAPTTCTRPRGAGVTLTFVTWGSGKLAAGRKPIEASLARAGIRLKVKTYEQGDLWEKSLQLPAKRLEHQLGQSVWRLDYFGDNARQSIVPQYDSRIPAEFGADFSEYDNPTVNRLIDRALAEPVRDRRAAMWAELDQQIMRDAPLVPLLWENFSFQWASRVHGWVYDPWTVGPDLTSVWLDPANP
jgi:peptide/nickel transport system substrate-binding protein